MRLLALPLSLGLSAKGGARLFVAGSPGSKAAPADQGTRPNRLTVIEPKTGRANTNRKASGIAVTGDGSASRIESAGFESGPVDLVQAQ